MQGDREPARKVVYNQEQPVQDRYPEMIISKLSKGGYPAFVVLERIAKFFLGNQFSQRTEPALRPVDQVC